MARAKNWRLEKVYGTVGGARFAAVTYLPTGRRFDVPIRGRADGGSNAWGDPYPYEETRRGKIYEMADKMYAAGQHRQTNPRRRRVVGAKRRRSARQAGSRRNPMPKGKAFKSGGFKETLTVIRAGGFVEQMKYEDANDRQRYFHDFEDLGAQLFLCDSVAFGKCILVVSSDEKPLWEPA